MCLRWAQWPCGMGVGFRDRRRGTHFGGKGYHCSSPRDVWCDLASERPGGERPQDEASQKQEAGPGHAGAGIRVGGRACTLCPTGSHDKTVQRPSDSLWGCLGMSPGTQGRGLGPRALGPGTALCPSCQCHQGHQQVLALVAQRVDGSVDDVKTSVGTKRKGRDRKTFGGRHLRAHGFGEGGAWEWC